MFDFFANPTRFARIAHALLPWLKLISLTAFGCGLYWGLITSPADYQQGETVRIMYIHVPVAWLWQILVPKRSRQLVWFSQL